MYPDTQICLVICLCKFFRLVFIMLIVTCVQSPGLFVSIYSRLFRLNWLCLYAPDFRGLNLIIIVVFTNFCHL